MLLALHEIWPKAPLYTAVYDHGLAKWASVFQVNTSFLQFFPFAKRHHELYPWLTPAAFESFNFDQYDIVISITSAEAKFVLTKPHTLHICYCLTPTRYLWSAYKQYQDSPGMGVFNPLFSFFQKRLTPFLREWDIISANRPDYYLAISNTVAERIKKLYHRQVERVIYPPVNTDIFTVGGLQRKNKHKEDYYLVVSRLVSYKKIDIIIQAFNKLGWRLNIIGDGTQRQELEKSANSNITFLGGNLTDKDLLGYYQNCRALLYAAEEDFGLSAVEAQACGRPVIAYRRGGLTEVVQEGRTGMFFQNQTKEDLIHVLSVFTERNFSPYECRSNAVRFSQEKFTKTFKQTVESLYKEYTQ